MTENEKLKSPSYISVPKFRSYLQTIIALVSLLGFLVIGIRTVDLTFDTQKQKNDVIDSLKDKHPVTPVVIDRHTRHTENGLIHMTFDEKTRIIRIENNQTVIGQDLEEIKNLIRKQQ